jgi:hypothetical protein
VFEVGDAHARAALAGYAFPWMPADPSVRAVIIEAGHRRSYDSSVADEPDIVLWGCVPIAHKAKLSAALSHAAWRERAALRMRRKPPTPYRVQKLHRLAPPPGRGGVLRERVKRILYSGLLIELATLSPRRIVDVIATDAGLEEVEVIHMTADGRALLRGIRAGETDVIVRIGPVEGPFSPKRGAEALALLRRLGVGPVPELRSVGEAAGTSWTAESVLPGRRPRRLTPRLRHLVAEFCAQLPAAERSPRAFHNDLDALVAYMPQTATRVERARSRYGDTIDAMPGRMRHGDLWEANLLTDGDRLTGIVDWDTWHPAGVPGTDLLHLFATQMRLKSKKEMGEVWLDRPWLNPEFAEVSRRYWTSVGIDPTPDVLEAIGFAWWASYVAAAMTRHAHLPGPGQWGRRNVDVVLDRFIHPA